MSEWCRFAVCYWHTFRGEGADPFGPGTMVRPWESGKDDVDNALKRAEVAFDFVQKLGVPYYAFHDRDVAPEGASVKETNENLWAVANKFKELQDSTGIKLLWGTANLFGNPRFAQGTSTSPSADVFAYCANSVKEMLDITKMLGGENYVFWGGREGYMSLLSTDIKRESDHFARFLQLAVDYAKEIDYTGQFLIEPKPCEPTKHQYDFDTATVMGFLRQYGLQDHFKMNIEANHATLAGHSFEHEIELCRVLGVLGSIDANRGDPQNGWDTDQFPNDYKEWSWIWRSIVKNGGIGSGGQTLTPKSAAIPPALKDYFHAHIGGMDVIAKGLLIAEQMENDGFFDNVLKERYSTFDSGIGATVEDGSADLPKSSKPTFSKKAKSARCQVPAKNS